MRRLVAASVVCAATALAPTAGAVEREHHIGLSLGPSFLVASGRTSFGGAVGAQYAYGINDMFDLLVEGSWALGSFKSDVGAPTTRPAWLANGSAGASYVFDVLQWVPYAGVLVGATTFSGGPLGRTKVLPDVTIALGLDYRIDRQWEVGVAGRQHMFFSEVSTYPSDTQVLARFQYTWGW